MLALSSGMLAAEIREFFYKLDNNELAYLLFKICLSITLSEILSILMILNRYSKQFDKTLKIINERLDSYDKLFNVADKQADNSEYQDFNQESIKMNRGKNSHSELMEYSQEPKISSRKTPIEDEDTDYVPLPEKPSRRGRSVKKYLHK